MADYIVTGQRKIRDDLNWELKKAVGTLRRLQNQFRYVHRCRDRSEYMQLVTRLDRLHYHLLLIQALAQEHYAYTGLNKGETRPLPVALAGD